MSTWAGKVISAQLDAVLLTDTEMGEYDKRYAHVSPFGHLWGETLMAWYHPMHAHIEVFLARLSLPVSCRSQTPSMPQWQLREPNNH